MLRNIMIAMLAFCLFAPSIHAEDKAPEAKAETKAEAKPEAKAETKAEAKPEAKTDAKADAKAPTPEQITEAQGNQARIILSEDLPYDVVYGKADAPLRVTEYASLTCPHCRAFHTDVFEKLKPSYIDSGKVRFVFRSYPLNVNALRAAMIVECGVPAEKRATFVGALFKAQEEWAYKEQESDVIEKIKSIAKLGGIDNSKFDGCAKDKKLEDAMLRQQLQAQKALGVSSTPTVYINDQKFFDKKDYETFAKAVDNFGKPVEAAPADATAPAADAPKADAAPKAEEKSADKPAAAPAADAEKKEEPKKDEAKPTEKKQ